MKQGTLDVMLGGMPAAIYVYEDGLVVVPGSKGARVGMALGALGALIGGAAARRGLAKRREQLDALQASSASQAVSVEGCEVLAPGDIRSIEVKKGLLGRPTADDRPGYGSQTEPRLQLEEAAHVARRGPAAAGRRRPAAGRVWRVAGAAADAAGAQRPRSRTGRRRASAAVLADLVRLAGESFERHGARHR